MARRNRRDRLGALRRLRRDDDFYTFSGGVRAAREYALRCAGDYARFASMASRDDDEFLFDLVFGAALPDPWLDVQFSQSRAKSWVKTFGSRSFCRYGKRFR